MLSDKRHIYVRGSWEGSNGPHWYRCRFCPREKLWQYRRPAVHMEIALMLLFTTFQIGQWFPNWGKLPLGGNMRLFLG